VPRYHLPLSGVTQFHADVGWTLGWLAFALVLGLRLTSAPARARQAGYLLLGLVAGSAISSTSPACPPAWSGCTSPPRS
jgi:hypothetical protein